MRRTMVEDPASPRGGGPVPGPDEFLDRGRLAGLLAAAFAECRMEIDSVDVRYVRAKRGRSVLLGLRLAGRGEAGSWDVPGSLYFAAESDVRSAAEKARALRIVEPAAGPALRVVEAGGGGGAGTRGARGGAIALYLAFPNDRSLRGLSAAADPRRLGNRLTRPGAPLRDEGFRVRARATAVEPVRWKVGRRAVLRAVLALRRDADAYSRGERLYIRVYPRAVVAGAVSRWRAAGLRAGPLHPPAVFDCDSDRGLIATLERPGSPLGTHACDESVWHALAEALGRLYAEAVDYGGGLAPRPAEQALHAGARSLVDLAAWAPSETASTALALEGRLRLAARGMAACAPSFIHGDLTADQILVAGDGFSLLDWDEAGAGDPHSDLASLAADATLRGLAPPPEGFAAWAAGVLGARFDERLWRWHLALAHARRSLSGLQSGRAGWREEAERALSCAVQAEAGNSARARRTGPAGRPVSSRPAPMPRHVPSRPAELRPVPAPDTSAALRAALDAIGNGPLRLAALWPDAAGFAACYERPERPRVPAVWVRSAGALEVWPFPEDPALPRLKPLVAAGWRVMGHRLGRRAALGSPDSSVLLHLRPPPRARAALLRLQAVEHALVAGGVRATRSMAPTPEGDGWFQERLPGRVLDPPAAGSAVWVTLGGHLARVHAVAPPDGTPPRDPDGALRSAWRQIGPVVAAGGELGEWIADEWERALGDAPCGDGAARSGARASLIHGDLHPGQVLVCDGPTLLDWERAGAGDPEEDLGNLAAHLRWQLGREAPAAWRSVCCGYRSSGGAIEPSRFAWYSRTALLRVLALHSWRDLDRSRVLLNLDDWTTWLSEVEPC